ncbi:MULTISPECIES: PHB depolymerase family esterase [unclassified Roseovarius]|uniref:alpha/beta hydrolase family esterase n=1 Tax=unclassified Roseovarius TaxID=2614913 RepID=UPI00273D5720|nr:MULTISPECIES: hypothetical protein [unclassified Roseovarius]
MRHTGTISALLWGLLLALTGQAAGERTLRPVHDGVERLIWMVDGRTDKDKPAPLVLALHGYRNAERALKQRETPERLGWKRLEDLARQDGFIVLFPHAYLGQWNLFDGLENTTGPDGQTIDDQSFLLDLVAELVADGMADPARLHITGISDGAIMTYRLICLQDTPFAAAAPLIGTPSQAYLTDCAPTPPPALLHLHGTHDKVLPYEGWIFPNGREVSVPEVMDHWRRLHGCTGQTGRLLDDIDPDDGSTVGVMVWTGCNGQDPVIRYKVIDGGHSVPALDARQREDPDRRINRDIDTLGVVWQFFSRRSRVSPQ